MSVRYNVEIAAIAERDLEEIWGYIDADGPENATAFVVRPEEQINTLERLSERCPLIPENEQPGTSYRHLLYDTKYTLHIREVRFRRASSLLGS